MIVSCVVLAQTPLPNRSHFFAWSDRFEEMRPDLYPTLTLPPVIEKRSRVFDISIQTRHRRSKSGVYTHPSVSSAFFLEVSYIHNALNSYSKKAMPPVSVQVILPM